MTHNEAVNRAILTISECGGRAFRREVGLFYDERGNKHFVGFPGEPDVQGWIPPNGRKIAVEVKTGRAGRKKNQRAWAARACRDGVLYVVARYSDAEDGDETIRTAIKLARMNACALPAK